MTIKYSQRYVVDACVLLAYQDPDEAHHREALAFFQLLDKFSEEGKPVTIVIPAYFYIEVNLNTQKKKQEVTLGKRQSYEPMQTRENLEWEGYAISLDLMKSIEEKGLYEEFGTNLRSGDFIYAAIASIESIPVVTLDKGFLSVSSNIEVICLI